MNPEAKNQLSIPRLPARLTAEQAGIELGFSTHDIPILANRKLLIPLGKPARNSVKYFAAVDIKSKVDDVGWLNRATEAIQKHWQS